MARELWALDEYAVVADLYLRRGRSSEGDPEVRLLAELTGRSAASISRRLGNFDGTHHPGRGLKPVTGEALLLFTSMASDIRVRERWGHEAAEHLRSARRGLPVPLRDTAPRLVLPEVSTVDAVEITTVAQLRRIVREEAALVTRFRAWLDPEGARLRAWAIPVGSESLRADLYDTATRTLIEAKASTARNFVRQAVGQLLDYRRYLSPRPELAVLLPEELNADLAALLRELGIGVIWEAGDRFLDSEGGRFVRGG